MVLLIEYAVNKLIKYTAILEFVSIFYWGQPNIFGWRKVLKRNSKSDTYINSYNNVLQAGVSILHFKLKFLDVLH